MERIIRRNYIYEAILHYSPSFLPGNYRYDSYLCFAVCVTLLPVFGRPGAESHIILTATSAIVIIGSVALYFAIEKYAPTNVKRSTDGSTCATLDATTKINSAGTIVHVPPKQHTVLCSFAPSFLCFCCIYSYRSCHILHLHCVRLLWIPSHIR